MWFIGKYPVAILTIFQLLGYSSCLRDVRITMPAAVQRGSTAALRCQYDIEADLLYSVKWYRGDREFYRFMPKENPVMKVFPIPGLNVVRKLSNASVVTLDSVDEGAAGRYSCEVSADAPSFHTFMVTAAMDVVDIPAHRPVITGIKPRYRTGALLRGNCTCKHSRPAANLTWYINGHQANPSYTKRYRSPEFINSDGLLTAVMGIHFLVTPQHFGTGKLKIRCAASVYSVYYQSTEKSIEEERIRNVHTGVGGNHVDGEGGAPPESQHVALMYPVHGTVYDQDLPPIARDTAHALGGADCSRKNGKLAMSFIFFYGILRHLFNYEHANIR